MGDNLARNSIDTPSQNCFIFCKPCLAHLSDAYLGFARLWDAGPPLGREAYSSQGVFRWISRYPLTAILRPVQRVLGIFGRRVPQIGLQ